MKRYIPFLLCAFLFACASDGDIVLTNEESYYNFASDSLEANRFNQAISAFQQLEAQYPFGKFAAQAQIELVYAYYRNREPEAARAAADRYIRLNPDEDNLDYAYYMKGMSFYSEDSRMLGRYLPTDPSKRDPGKARESFTDFSQLVSRYPNSPYAADARARMIYLRNMLAASEIHVAEFYIERQAFLSSLNRARFVVENYQGAPSVQRALEIIVEMYLRLGLEDLANASLTILRQNHPDSITLNEDGNFLVSTQITDPSFIYSVSFGLLGSNKTDAPLAPTKRPVRDEAAYTFQLEEGGQRSFLNLITLGLLGDDGPETITVVPQEEE